MRRTSSPSPHGWLPRSACKANEMRHGHRHARRRKRGKTRVSLSGMTGIPRYEAVWPADGFPAQGILVLPSYEGRPFRREVLLLTEGKAPPFITGKARQRQTP